MKSFSIAGLIRIKVSLINHNIDANLPQGITTKCTICKNDMVFGFLLNNESFTRDSETFLEVCGIGSALDLMRTGNPDTRI